MTRELKPYRVTGEIHVKIEVVESEGDYPLALVKDDTLVGYLMPLSSENVRAEFDFGKARIV